VDEWVTPFDDPILANSAFDRFAHRVHQIVMEGRACARRGRRAAAADAAR
jgi:hypothetical protein